MLYAKIYSLIDDKTIYFLFKNQQQNHSPVYPELASLYGAAVPDFRGMFLRGLGSQTFNSGGYGNVAHASGNLAQVQGDAIRNITAVSGTYRWFGSSGSGAIAQWVWGGWTDGGGANGIYGMDVFDASRVVPTAIENRPVNMAVRYLIRALK